MMTIGHLSLVFVFSLLCCTLGEEIKLLHVGSPLKIYCNYTHPAGETLSFRWLKNQAPLSPELQERVSIENHEEEYEDGEGVLGNTKTSLRLEDTKDEDVGHYACELTTASYQQVFLVTTAYQKRLPKSTVVEEGDVLSVTCQTSSDENLSATISWEKDSVPLEFAVNASRLSFFPNADGAVDGGFNITDAMQSDRGEYTCFAYFHENLAMNTTTNVRVKDPLRVLWPIIGIVAQALLLGATIFICEKTRHKEEDEDDDELAAQSKPVVGTEPQPSTSAVNA